MSDPVMAIWNNLKAESEYVLPVGDHSFDYPKESPYVKGVFNNPRIGSQMRFMSFPVGVHTYETGTLLHSQPAVITFYQVGEAQWLFAMSESAQRATFQYPQICCHHAVDLAKKLAKGEEAEMRITDGDGVPLVAKVRPLALDLN